MCWCMIHPSYEFCLLSYPCTMYSIGLLCMSYDRVGSSHHQALFWDRWVNLDGWMDGLLLLLLLLLLLIRPYLSIDIRYWDTIFTDHHFLLCLFRRQGFRNIVPEKISIFRFYTILYIYTYFRLLTFCQKLYIDST